MDEVRFDRQIRLFGKAGQERLEATSVAIVGLGGLGSHVAQQLAYLGLRDLRLVDGDTVSASNLNRLVGAVCADAVDERRKVDVAARLVRSLDPDRHLAVMPVRDSFISTEGYAALKGADVVVGCMDRAAPRLILTEFCQAYERPFIDIATDIGADGGLWFGGRILFSLPGEMCLHCMDMLDPEELRRDFSTAQQRTDNKRIYGVDRDDLGDTGPAVVFLNGLLASAAVTELMAYITGIRPPVMNLEYRGMQGKLFALDDTPAADCYYCKQLRGAQDAADLERFIREGWGQRF